jgi:hypothetical protein
LRNSDVIKSQPRLLIGLASENGQPSQLCF